MCFREDSAAGGDLCSGCFLTRWFTGIYGLNSFCDLSLGVHMKQRLALWIPESVRVLLNLVFLISLVDVILFHWYSLGVWGESFSISIFLLA